MGIIKGEIIKNNFIIKGNSESDGQSQVLKIIIDDELGAYLGVEIKDNAPIVSLYSRTGKLLSSVNCGVEINELVKVTLDYNHKEMIFEMSNGDELFCDVSAIVDRLESLRADLTSEINRATQKEALLQSEIDDEVTRAQTAESNISNRVTAIENDYLTSTDKTELEGEISTETTARENADSALSGRITAIEDGFITQDINTSSIGVQYTKSISKVSLVGDNEWLPYSSATNKELYSVTYGNGYFIACGQDGVIVYSKTGKDWILLDRTIGSSRLDKIVYGNGYFLAISYTNNTIYKAYSPILWEIFSELEGITPTNLQYINNKFVVSGTNGKIGFSVDGKKFKYVQTPSSATIKSVAYGNSAYVLVGTGGLLLYSHNGENWYDRSNELFTDDYNNVIFNNGLFVATSTGAIKYSTDYYSFQDATIPSITNYTIKCIECGESSYRVLITNNNDSKVLKSSNGKVFELDTSINVVEHSLCYGNSAFILLGINGTVYNLDLSINWSYEKPSLSGNEFLWCRDVNNLNNGDTLYSSAYYMGYVDKDVDNLTNYYDIPTSNSLLDTKQDDMDRIPDSDINNLFN